MPSFKWGCGLLVLFFICACSTTAQLQTDPQGRISPSDRPPVGKNAKNGRADGAPASLPRGTETKPQGLGPGFSGVDPSVRPPADCPPGTEPGTLAAGQTARAAGANGSENGDPDIDEEIDEIVELLRLAQAYRDKGDMDSALKSLDKAYGILLGEEESNSTVIRQKDDLRLLIARKILDIYTGKRVSTVGRQSEIPLIMNADVEKEIRSFQTVERNFFERSYERAGYYLPIMKQHLRQAGIPEELAWLPLVESGFQVHALSKARALGPWQFIPSTGYKYGLNRDLYIDERMNVEKSTQAAIAYLTDLHSLFGDWLTALAAYNCGEGRVLKVISRQQSDYLDHFWDLYRQLPYETARYVPRFLATLHIVKNPKKFGMNLPDPYAKPIAFETVRTFRSMKLFDIACQMGISTDTLVMLNPELRHQITPDRPYELKIPQGLGPQYALVADQIRESKPPAPPERERKAKIVKYRVKQGDSVASVSKKFGLSSRSLMAANGMKNEGPLTTGRILKIPVKPKDRGTAVAAGKKGKSKKAAATAVVRHTVKKGETLTQIAKRYGMTPAEIQRMNELQTTRLKSGQVLKIRGPHPQAGG
ncbi:MAG: LysM peptidoglycan-binding domain-containing protein [Pseudomonadota bacterium]|jgi:membrane-bound lytic murein transglycosylase D|nr:LysM peptidoglycan-binding domain-containing protein [Syntrophobacterales bacterium]MDI9555926.1 LysM peptidoglycan-binding domain-containing protein [Pseudomonadota bacterium]NLX31122.1 LysM peptidoglycan-binding domain-containing protein [Deltaproteobacteria bacterium]HNU85241.1 LysM peptidoglycan-binding domain-containing protein [Syntrophales bacterium]HNZ34523.1 LysM peptidoglycan-binding domain-containing protein [Syntrophales bacterium]